MHRTQAAGAKPFSLDVALAVLRLYALQLSAARPDTVAKVLLKALTQLPASAYKTCAYLVPERAQGEEPLSTLVLLAAHLESGRLADFWALAQGSRDMLALGACVRVRACVRVCVCVCVGWVVGLVVHRLVAAVKRGVSACCSCRDIPQPACTHTHIHTHTVPGFMDAARRFVAHSLTITYAKLPKRQAGEALRLEGKELDAYLQERVRVRACVCVCVGGEGALCGLCVKVG